MDTVFYNTALPIMSFINFPGKNIYFLCVFYRISLLIVKINRNIIFLVCLTYTLICISVSIAGSIINLHILMHYFTYFIVLSFFI